MLTDILISVAFLTACGLTLAALLALAERYILNYGEVAIDINDGAKRLTAPGGGTLLAALADHDIFLPSACGGRGTCAYCKVRVLEGGGTPGPVEAPYLTEDEVREQVRLSCQVKLRNDVRIAIPEALFSIRRFRGHVAHKRPLTGDIVELRIALDEPGEIEFVAGQYIQLESQAYGGREPVMRAYSISSPPSAKKTLETVIRLVPDGICTTWVFEVLKEGDAVSLSGPYGEFRLSDSERPCLFIAGGSGMAPIWSLLRDMREKGDRRPVTYFFGALTQADLFYVDELRALEKDMEEFRFVPALSNEPDDSDWSGERGLITDVLARRVPDMSGHEAYLCGSPGMIDAAIATLKKGGMPEDRIFYDKFA
jgi:Na+-transporting NADH:ubiquinone oxidoreductase subunit F